MNLTFFKQVVLLLQLANPLLLLIKVHETEFCSFELKYKLKENSYKDF